jgi:tetratricopeptide (TPR) repeat protein
VAQLLAARGDRAADQGVLLALATAYNARNMPEEAKAACDELLHANGKHGDGWYEAIIARSFGERAELEALVPKVDRLAREHADAAWAQRNRGLLRYFLEDDEGTRAACTKALQADARDARTHEVLAYLAYTVGDLDGAIESGIKAVELDPRSFRALHWLGECYLKLDATEQAVRYFQRALRLEECHFYSLESLGSVYLQSPETFAQATQCFARILAVNPRYFPVYFRLADACIQAQRLTEAAAQAEAVLHLSPDKTAEADAHQYLGLVRLIQRDHAGARPCFERALRIDPRFAAAHHYLGVLHEQAGDMQAAEASFRKAMASDPRYALPRVRLAYLAYDRKEYANAKRLFEQALAVDASEYMAHLGLGELARSRKDYADQLARCRRAAELAPDDGNVRNQLGTAHDALGDLEAARREYEEALRLDPFNRQAANNLGYLYERLLKDAPAREAPSLRAKAVSAWKRRLLICRDMRSSTRGARAHLARLGVSPRKITEWLESETVG